ncbi:MAG: hypothetical protein EBR82_49430 [Caulobacteraceae bacterium]|nr:hypothetical protein [Caulobacteraceae bacterium]NDG32575.1 hypothetical protein [bacterium]
MNQVIDNIVWENNSRVKNSGLINSTKIIQKTSTEKFPAGKVTIRLYNTSKENLSATAYFYGKLKTYTSTWGGSSYNNDYPDGKLMVNFHKDKDEYIFNGGVSESYSLQDVTDVISYCKELLNKL